MKRKRYTTERIVAAIKQHELGTPAADIIRKLGIAEQNFYRWKRRYAGLEPSQVRELNQCPFPATAGCRARFTAVRIAASDSYGSVSFNSLTQQAVHHFQRFFGFCIPWLDSECLLEQ